MQLISEFDIKLTDTRGNLNNSTHLNLHNDILILIMDNNSELSIILLV